MNIVKVKWVDPCFFTKIPKDYNIEHEDRPVFSSLGVDLGRGNCSHIRETERCSDCGTIVEKLDDSLY